MKKLLILALTLTSLTAAAQSGDKTWVLDAKSLVSFLIGNQVKPNNGNSYNKNVQNVYLSFGYNTGDMEFGPIFSYYNKDESGVAETTTSYGAYYRYNFVPNVFTEAIIPFARLDVIVDKVEVQNQKDADSLAFALKGGVTFFPFSNNIVGLSAFVGYRNAKETGLVDAKVNGAQLGTEFNLYF